MTYRVAFAPTAANQIDLGSRALSYVPLTRDTRANQRLPLIGCIWLRAHRQTRHFTRLSSSFYVAKLGVWLTGVGGPRAAGVRTSRFSVGISSSVGQKQAVCHDFTFEALTAHLKTPEHGTPDGDRGFVLEESNRKIVENIANTRLLGAIDR